MSGRRFLLFSVARGLTLRETPISVTDVDGSLKLATASLCLANAGTFASVQVLLSCGVLEQSECAASGFKTPPLRGSTCR